MNRVIEPVLLLSFLQRATSRFESKLGGEPYMTWMDQYPLNGRGDPLHFLCQINFEEMAPLPSFPKEGILQFYITRDYGHMPWSGFCEENGDWRVIYHPTINRDPDLQATVPPIDPSRHFPFQGEFHISGTYNEETTRFKTPREDAYAGSEICFVIIVSS
ncbi:putative protein of unknown function (DUF1963) [Blattamonas nauphoetae]|uniref:Uncharacterized protein n=1 Tax=Blattamonas nauphoetae TaxID=2049346 RepID=A0ABQ9XII0_9EUKA|nr:putative protein of unknown function (DUF1963) [Blattamonas nauphoetae]